MISESLQSYKCGSHFAKHIKIPDTMQKQQKKNFWLKHSWVINNNADMNFELSRGDHNITLKDLLVFNDVSSLFTNVFSQTKF